MLQLKKLIKGILFIQDKLFNTKTMNTNKHLIYQSKK